MRWKVSLKMWLGFAVTGHPSEAGRRKYDESSFARKVAFRSLFMIDNRLFDRILCPRPRMYRGLASPRNAMGAATNYASPDQEDFFGGQSYGQSFSQRQGEFYEVFS